MGLVLNCNIYCIKKRVWMIARYDFGPSKQNLDQNKPQFSGNRFLLREKPLF
jgi:hypothetical protein